jgi:hypothetical protein
VRGRPEAGLHSSLARQASRLATDVQASLKKARLEGERRLLQRQHRTALEELGERTYELVKTGAMPEGELGPELAAVESKLMEIEAKVAEIEALRTETSDEEEPAPAGTDAAFPMVDGDPPASPPPASETPAEPTRKTGWEGADRFFKT